MEKGKSVFGECKWMFHFGKESIDDFETIYEFQSSDCLVFEVQKSKYPFINVPDEHEFSVAGYFKVFNINCAKYFWTGQLLRPSLVSYKYRQV